MTNLREEFVARVLARLERGAAEYGDESFARPLAATFTELLSEAEDLAGWAYCVWRQLRARLARIAVAVLDDEAAEAVAPAEPTPGPVGDVLAAMRQRRQRARAGAPTLPTTADLDALANVLEAARRGDEVAMAWLHAHVPFERLRPAGRLILASPTDTPPTPTRNQP